ncbi:hypothetical protein [Nocardioides alkalitolerans]|uniref:hypothetical protein n=1 Tax=Nocardioides alkalitolerans TaxID=281714 RepID=UPI00040FAE6B|nr:hypothetical protein [Nocardioides alkalitolerans]
MSALVPSTEIEAKVGASRHETKHLGRAVSAEQVVYVLHSKECRDSGIDLRDCPFSTALDRGIDTDRWAGHQDQAVVLVVAEHGRLEVGAQ